ncbi:MAG: DUF2142 domain-containing protein [Thermoguttaceae bacterium]
MSNAPGQAGPAVAAPLLRPHRILLWCGLLLGGSLVFMTPPFGVPDEFGHFLRAYQCSEGAWYASRNGSKVGGELPVSLLTTYTAIVGHTTPDKVFRGFWQRIPSARAIPLAAHERLFIGFPNMALYSPVVYLPCAVALWTARWTPCSPLALLYCGRLANLAVYLALTVLAVKWTPVLKWTMALVAMMPLSMFLAASVSADAVTLALALLATAAALRLAMESAKASAGNLAALALLLSLLALSKQVYVTMALLFFAVPRNKFGGLRAWLLGMLLVVGLPVTLNIAWASSVRPLYEPIMPWVDPQAQVHHIVTHLPSYTAVVFKAMVRKDTYVYMIGLLGWLNVFVPNRAWQYYGLAVLATAVLDRGPRPLPLRMKLALLGTYIVGAAAVITMVYLSSGHVGAKRVEGMQPRYLLPLILLLLQALCGHNLLAAVKHSRLFLPVITISAAMVGIAGTWYAMVAHYYLPM